MERPNTLPKKEGQRLDFDQALLNTADELAKWNLDALAAPLRPRSKNAEKLGTELLGRALAMLRLATATQCVAILTLSPANRKWLRVWKTEQSSDYLRLGQDLHCSEQLLQKLQRADPGNADSVDYYDVSNHITNADTLRSFHDNVFYPVDIPLGQQHRQWLLTAGHGYVHNSWMDISGRLFAGMYRLVYVGRFGILMSQYELATQSYLPELVSHASGAFLRWAAEFGAPVSQVVLRDYVDSQLAIARDGKQGSHTAQQNIHKLIKKPNRFLLLDAEQMDVTNLVNHADDVCRSMERNH